MGRKVFCPSGKNEQQQLPSSPRKHGGAIG
jgi:hypothetical protein